MNFLLKQICDARFGKGELNIKAHMPDRVNFSSFFTCPMISMDYLDCISGNDGSDRMEARAKFIRTKFFTDNCYYYNRDKTVDKSASFSEIAENCKVLKNGLACWTELASELLKVKEK